MSARPFAGALPVRFSGSATACWILHRLGWRVKFAGLPDLQGVLVVYPHTSNWDFWILVLVKWSQGIPVRFWAKDKLFRIPLFGRWLQFLGGVPVRRVSPTGVVGQAVRAFAQAQAQSAYFWLALAPEGTRKLIPGWRSGFYHSALQARVPVGLVKLDYGQREVVAMDFIYLTGNEGEDFKRIAQVYDGVRGLKPGNAAPIRLIDASVSRTETVIK